MAAGNAAENAAFSTAYLPVRHISRLNAVRGALLRAVLRGGWRDDAIPIVLCGSLSCCF